MKKLIRIISFMFAIMMLVAPCALAATPYQTYTYSIDGTVLDSPDAYVPYGNGAVTSASLGLEKPLSSPSDIESDADENIYITDKGNNRIVITDKYYSEVYIIKDFINADGIPDSFNTPVSTFVVSEGDFEGIYVCDKGNHRIVKFARDTKELEKIYNEPKGLELENTEAYTPVSCVVDKHGRMYVISDQITKGIIALTSNGEFINYIGAAKVSVDALGVIMSLFGLGEDDVDVPTSFSNLELDESTGDFLYATILYKTDEDKENQFNAIESKNPDYAPVRLLNASGVDIMNRNGFFAPAGEVAVKLEKDVVKTTTNKDAPVGVSEIIDVSSGPNGVWSIIDNKRSKIYTYDKNGNLLYIFGDIGNQFGNLTNAKAITYQGEKIVVLDVSNSSFTVYRRTEYAQVLDTAIEYQNGRDFEAASEAWDEVLAWNNNFDTAYVEKGKSLYRAGNFSEASNYFKNAYDTENYAAAFKEMRADIMETLFIPMIVGIVLLVIGLAWVFKKAGKINTAAAVKAGNKSFKEELTYGFHLMFHPFDGYWDLKHEKRGSIRASLVFIGATVLAFYWQAVGQSYYYMPEGSTATIFSQITAVLIPLLLFMVSNWCFTTLFDGEGSFKDIFIATSYALFPVPVLVAVSTLLTHALVGTEGQIVTMVVSIAYIWMIFLMVIGMQVTHDYSMGKNILTILATILGMIIIMFIAVLFTSLISKMVTLVTSIVSELSYR